MAKDARFKEYLTKLLSDTGVNAQSALKVGELPLEIDIFLTSRKEDDLSTFAPLQTVLDHSKTRKLVVEYKSHNDLLRFNHLYRIIGYRALYLSMNLRKTDPSDVGLLVITTQLPRKILQTLEFSKLQPGIFLLNFEFPIYIITINYLPIQRENYGLLFFSTGKKLLKFIRTIISMENQTDIEQMFISYASVFYHEELSMARSVEEIPNLTRNVRQAVKFFGLKEVIDAVGLKEVIDAVGLEKIVTSLSDREISELRKYLDKRSK